MKDYSELVEIWRKTGAIDKLKDRFAESGAGDPCDIFFGRRFDAPEMLEELEDDEEILADLEAL